MIDEQFLWDFLHDAAERVDVPAEGPQRVLEVARLTAPASPVSRLHDHRNGLVAFMAAAAAIALVVAAVVSVGGGRSTKTTAAHVSMAPGQLRGPQQQHAPSAGRGRTQQLDRNLTGYAPYGLGATPPTTAAAAQPTAGGTVTAADSAKIVRTATVQLQLQRGTLDTTLDDIRAIAVGTGGYVSSSQSSEATEIPTAAITVRVPFRSFDAVVRAIQKARGIDKILGLGEQGQDVTAQYTDLAAQLRAQTNERDQLLVVLGKTKTIGEILAVRDRISSVQTQLDQLQGRINLLDDQAALSSIAVSLAEKAPPAKVAATAKPKAKHGGGLADAWADARHGFADSVESILSHSGGTLVVIVGLLALVFLIRYLYPVLRRGLL